MHNCVRIRAARADDLAILPQIERSAGAAFSAVAGLEWIEHDTVMSADDHAAFLETGTTWVAAEDDVLGFLCAQVHAGCLHVHELSVARPAQGRGIGRALLDHAAAHARGAGLAWMTLVTFRDVPFNAPLYARCGFSEIPPPETPHWLAIMMQAEGARGLPAGRRCAMRRGV